MNETAEYLNRALKIAEKASSFLLSRFNQTQKVSVKEKNDIVTEVDIESEKIIIAGLKENFPSHNILSEEAGQEYKLPSKYLWVIDPLDGTINYSAGLPWFSVSLALLEEQTPILGVIFAPYLNELFFAERGKGAFLNNSKIFVSKNRYLKDSLINIALSAHYSTKQSDLVWQIVKELTPQVRGVRILESGALTSCYIAAGRLDGKISIKTDAYGTAAATLIIEEAGGKTTDFSGQPWSMGMKNKIASNALIHNDLLRLVSITPD